MSGMQLFGTPLSGHTHRVRLLLTMLDLPFDFKDAPAAVRQTGEFKQLNPLAQVPVLIDDGQALTDSNAIMVYLVKRYAPGSHWLPEDALNAAEVQKWLSHAAGEVRYGPASARMVKQFSAPEAYGAALAIAGKFLPQMEQHLLEHEFLATGRATIADLACYSYVATAPEGGVSLAPYPAIRRWLARIERLPGFAAMPALPPPEDIW
ncbi:glutathione S-transferase [Sodalis sp. RH21]|uniref:glutathione S-transferase n=1 Tax=unclassified Sodalis (in: enterobacteria) TaxID=2636512 RepID=UPI0039B5365A